MLQFLIGAFVGCGVSTIISKWFVDPTPPTEIQVAPKYGPIPYGQVKELDPESIYVYSYDTTSDEYRMALDWHLRNIHVHHIPISEQIEPYILLYGKKRIVIDGVLYQESCDEIYQMFAKAEQKPE